MRRAWHWARTHPWVGAVVFTAAALIVSALLLRHEFQQEGERDRAQDERERREDIQEQIDLLAQAAHEECANANESRRLVRDMGVQLNVAAVSASTEALILVAMDSPNPPDPAAIETYRRLSAEQATTRASAIVATLVDRDCAAEERVARADAEALLRP